MKVVIAGASGFVGRELTAALAPEHELVCLTRRALPAEDQITWRQANLFSLLDVERGVDGADVGVYLVHSMLPTSRMTQGTFADLDTILADNFARACKRAGVKKIVYLGGLIPEGELSPHLASRLEVERVLASHGVPVIALRAGLIIGPDGSSFRILERLVDRLPAMVCPAWTQRRCQPIALTDIVRIMTHVVSDTALAPGAYDVAGPDVLTYADMMRYVARVKGKRRWFVNVPFVSPHLSRLWVSTVTRTPKSLVYPLIESLRHDMVAREERLATRYGISAMGFDDAVRAATAKGSTRQLAAFAPSMAPTRLTVEDSTVTSVQRLPVPRGRSLDWLVREYTRWVPTIMTPVIAVKGTVDGSIAFMFRPLSWVGKDTELLQLTYSRERSSPTRQLFYLTGGWLLGASAGRARGRLEFRVVPAKREVIAAVLDYRPSLPWWLYSASQALVHWCVMRLFQRHLSKQDRLALGGLDYVR